MNETVARFFGEINVLERHGKTRFIRPDQLRLTMQSPADCLAFGHVTRRDYAGDHIRLEIQAGDRQWIVHTPPSSGWNTGDAVTLCQRQDHAGA